MPKVSICVPVYNTGKYLDERIKTFESQTYDDYEVIILDGFSSDGYGKKFVNIKKEILELRLFNFHQREFTMRLIK